MSKGFVLLGNAVGVGRQDKRRNLARLPVNAVQKSRQFVGIFRLCNKEIRGICVDLVCL